MFRFCYSLMQERRYVFLALTHRNITWMCFTMVYDLHLYANFHLNGSIALNSLWPSDTIWRHKTRSTLAQVMACCLTAPSHYLNQCWLSSVRSHGIHLMALSLDDAKIPINKTRLKIAVLKWHLGLPGASQLTHCGLVMTYGFIELCQHWCI